MYSSFMSYHSSTLVVNTYTHTHMSAHTNKHTHKYLDIVFVFSSVREMELNFIRISINQLIN